MRGIVRPALMAAGAAVMAAGAAAGRLLDRRYPPCCPHRTTPCGACPDARCAGCPTTTTPRSVP